MRLYMVRRTRSFIQDNYAETDPTTGRKYLTFADGTRSYFPTRQPKTVKFTIDDNDPHDQYALLYSAPCRRRHQSPSPCRATAWATTSRNARTNHQPPAEGQDHR